MQEHTCINCQYFLRHYIIKNEKVIPIYCGHCTHLKQKNKKPYSKACDLFVEDQKGLDRFVTKEYLTKELLQYFLQMQLFPNLEELNKQHKQ